MAASIPNPVNAARQRVQNLKIQGVKDPKRVLLAILDYLPQPGLNTVATEICGCTNDDELRQLADHYVTTVFKPMKASGGMTPRSVPSPVPGDEGEVVQLSGVLGPPQNRLSTRRGEQMCLPRDDYRCVVTNILSEKSPENMRPPNEQLTPTRACHIIPLALARCGNSDQELLDASPTWDTLYRMFPNLQNIISGNLEDINNPRNLFTACTSVHETFGKFELALREVPGQPNTYTVVHWHRAAIVIPFLHQNNQIQIVNHAPGTNLPDPYLFRVHLILAEILHASGLVEVLDQVLDDYSLLSGLDSDGSTTIPYLIEAP